MRKFAAALFFAASLCLIVELFASGGQEQLHPYLRAVLSQTERTGALNLAGLSSFLQVFGADGVILPCLPLFGGVEEKGESIGVLVKVTRPMWGASFLGLPVGVSTGTILCMRVTLEDLFLLAASPDVIYVEPAWRTEPKLDRSLPAIGVDRVHAQSPPVIGEGVIIGAVDTGIDYTHLDFRYDADGDGFEESSRILYIWDQTGGFFGTYYDKAQIESDLALGFDSGEGLVRQADTEGHGTHVMGVAAGDGSSSTAGFVGVAPAAQLIMVKTPFYTSDILAGVDYIFKRAEEHDLPAVVTLSLGGHSGPHDGTSLFEQGLDELVGEPGRAIIVSAGNEGDRSIHVSHTLHGNSSTFSVDPASDSVELSLWYPGGSFFTLTVAPSTGGALVVLAGSTGYTSTASGNIYVDNASAGVNPNNGDKEIMVTLSDLVSGLPLTFTVSDEGGGGRFDGWITSTDGGTILGGDSTHTIDEPGNAERVITVGAFNTKASWPSLSGEQDFLAQYPVGALSYFSSQGPTRDGRQKPELTAPGAWVAAALSADSTSPSYLTHPDGEHTMLLGTSISAPHISGVVALMLSINPQLTARDVRERLITTVASDVFTGSVPNPRWGWGKVAAETVVAAVEPPQDDGEKEIPVITVGENPVHDHALFTYELPAGITEATLYIYNIAGRPLLKVALAPGANEYEWNLVSDRGDPLGSGLYLYVLITDTGRSRVERLVIKR